jgi:hypothetical protein
MTIGADQQTPPLPVATEAAFRVALARQPAGLDIGRVARLRVWGAALAVWSALYAIAHVYWALGGRAGFSLLKPSATELERWEEINAIASVVLLVPVGLAIGLVHLRGRPRPHRVLLAATLVGATIAASHGMYGIAYRVLNIVGVIDIEGQSFELSTHPWVVWDLVLFEPWFLLEGILFVGVGRASLASARDRRRWLLACCIGIAAATVVGLLGVRVG